MSGPGGDDPAGAEEERRLPPDKSPSCGVESPGFPPISPLPILWVENPESHTEEVSKLSAPSCCSVPEFFHPFLCTERDLLPFLPGDEESGPEQ